MGELIYDDLDYFDREDPNNAEWNIADITNDIPRYSKKEREDNAKHNYERVMLREISIS